MTIVVDASVVIAWLLRDERTPEADALAELIIDEGARVPQLFPIEIANVLVSAQRRGRISLAYAEEQLALLDELSLSLDPETSAHATRTTFQLAVDDNLTVYDATYLELALRLEARLMTFDLALAGAARRRGLTVLP